MDIQPYLQRIRNEFPRLTFTKWSIPRQGLDHVAIILNKRLLFRFPKTQKNVYLRNKYKRLFPWEIQLLRFLAKRITLPIPQYMYVARDKSFGGYQMIYGKELLVWRYQKFSISMKRQAIRQVAKFLSELHATPLRIAKHYHIPEVLPRDELAESRKEYEKYLKPRLSRKDREVCERYFAERRWHADDTFLPVLTHNDLHSEHILCDPRKGLTGIIDFGDRAVTDPAIDFAEFWDYGQKFVHAVYRHYKGPKDTHFLARSFLRYKQVVLNGLINAVQGNGIWKEEYGYFRRIMPRSVQTSRLRDATSPQTPPGSF